MLGIGDLVQVAQGISQTLGKINQQLQALSRLSSGTFTMAAAATKVVSDANVAANSIITLTPTNAAAGTLQQSTEALYVPTASISPGVSFTVATSDGGSAAGTEAFSYLIYTPV